MNVFLDTVTASLLHGDFRYIWRLDIAQLLEYFLVVFYKKLHSISVSFSFNNFWKKTYII